MFSNLSRGSALHVIDRTVEPMKWYTGSVERVTPSINQYQNNFGQFPALDLDLTVNINGERKEFKGVHSNDFIADFGSDAFIISDSKDSLYNYVKSLLKTSKEATDVNVIKKHKAWIPQYEGVLSDMIPGSSNPSEVKELKEQVSNLQSQLAEALALLKQGNSKKESENEDN